MASAKVAVSDMVDLVSAEHGLSRAEAYMLCSVCAEPEDQRNRRCARLDRFVLLSESRFQLISLSKT